jgi:hypothetical protein
MRAWRISSGTRTARRRALALAAATSLVGCERSEPLILAPPSEHLSDLASRGLGAASLKGTPVIIERAFVAADPSVGCTGEASTACALDSFAGGAAVGSVVVDRQHAVRFSGWATNVAGTAVPAIIVVRLASATSFDLPVLERTRREDVARALKAPAAELSGYDLLASFTNVDPGSYSVSVLSVEETGNAFTCATKLQVEVE